MDLFKSNRKKLIIIIAVLAILTLAYFSLYLSYLGGAAGFLVAKLGGGRKEGMPGRIKSLVVSWRRYRLHLHHWLLGSIASVICAIQGIHLVTPEVFFGFIGGIICQGIYCYADWYKVIRVRATDYPVGCN